LAAARHTDLSRLISRWRAARRRVVARLIGPHGGVARDEVLREATPHGGVPLILPRRLYPRALAVTGDIGLRDLINDLPAGERLLVDLPSAALDVDTPQDLRAARLRRSGISP
jgi:CTP:molybdopterin cytidylyltransferase MocA